MNTTAGRAWLATGLVVFALLCLAAFSATNYPSWWYTRGVIETNATANDYAPVVQGQLKWIATNAADELQDNLPGGAGTSVNARLSEFTPSNNYFGVNLGQLKYVADPFYVRLIEEGYTNNYPWTTNTTDDADFAPAAIGQVKSVFSFDPGYDIDGDGLGDWWEVLYFGSTTNWAGGDDPDGDGFSNQEEYTAGANPAFSNPVPAVAITYPTDGGTLP